jgi:hypothetical protein
LAVVLLLPITAWGQQADKENQFDIGLQMLTHGELRNGGMIREGDGDSEKENEAKFLMNRARLTVDFRKNFASAEKPLNRFAVEAKVVAQSLGVWGMKGNNALSLSEAWAKLSDKTGLFMQMGRQALAYDDERIIGPNDWAMTALAHDVFKLGYEGHGHKAHAILAYNQNSNNVDGGTYYNKENGVQPYKTMHTLWYHYDVPKVPLGVSLLGMNVGMQAGYEGGKNDYAPHIEYQQVVGGYISFRPKRWSVEGSYYRQMGRNEEGAEIDAWMASGLATWTPRDMFGFQVGFDYLSGDDYMPVPKPGTLGMPKHEKIKYFLPVYGSQHKFYGAMDFFYLSNFVNTFSPGLQNAFVGAFVKPVKNLHIGVAYHYLAMATKLEDMDMTLGHEIEVTASYKLQDLVSFSAGFTYMTGSESMERLKRDRGDGNLRWGWFSVNFSPKIFSTKW